MRIASFRILLFLLGCGSLISPLHAGVVNVYFLKPEQFSDIGDANVRREEALGEIKRFIIGLGQKELPLDETLTVEVLDIDLAGDSRLVLGRSGDLRILKGTTDGPHISLRYTLTAQGRVLSNGKVDLADLAYLDRFRRNNNSAQLYPYEKRILAEWFHTSFSDIAEDAR